MRLSFADTDIHPALMAASVDFMGFTQQWHHHPQSHGNRPIPAMLPPIHSWEAVVVEYRYQSLTAHPNCPPGHPPVTPSIIHDPIWTLSINNSTQTIMDLTHTLLDIQESILQPLLDMEPPLSLTADMGHHRIHPPMQADMADTVDTTLATVDTTVDTVDTTLDMEDTTDTAQWGVACSHQEETLTIHPVLSTEWNSPHKQHSKQSIRLYRHSQGFHRCLNPRSWQHIPPLWPWWVLLSNLDI
jgi:hypothetical protein